MYFDDARAYIEDPSTELPHQVALEDNGARRSHHSKWAEQMQARRETAARGRRSRKR